MASDPSQRKQAIAMGYIFAAAAGVLLLQWLFAAYNTIETIPYSQFEQLVNDGKVAEVGVGQDTIQGKLKENDKLPSGKQAFVTARVDPQFAEKLAQKGVVVVTINYRLGIFGYFAHPELSKESGHNASGDWGSLDQIAGLKWIQRNIAAFGGDPANVTVMGQSAGGESIYQLQASPLARGLFARLSAWSGADLAPGGQVPRTLAEGEATGVKVQQMLRAKNVADMRAVPWQQVMATLAQAQAAGGGGNSILKGLSVRAK